MDAAPGKDDRSYLSFKLSCVADLLGSADTVEIAVNPDGTVWVERAGAARMEPAPERRMTAAEARSLGKAIADASHLLWGPDHPLLSTDIEVGGQLIRAQVVGVPAVDSGVAITLRRHLRRRLPLTEIGFLGGKPESTDARRRAQLDEVRALADVGDAAAALRLAVERRLNILVAGGTSSGKTTLVSSLLDTIDAGERLVTIEDALELMPAAANRVQLLAERDQASPRSPARLLEATLRLRPDRIIVGELRGEEAYDFLEAINTGHPGSISTIHANSPELALRRLALLVLRAGTPLTPADVRDYAALTLDLIVQVDREHGRRGVREIFLTAPA